MSIFKKNSANTIPDFAHANRKLLMIICDPENDSITVCYKDRFASGKIKSATGKSTHVVKDVLKHSRFERTIGDFIGTIAETLNLPLVKGNQFYQFIDGALYKISKALSEVEKR